MNRHVVPGLAAAALLASCASTATPAPLPPPAGRGDEPGRARIYRVAPERGACFPAADTAGTLQVSATGEVEVSPDRARVAFAVETEAETAGDAAEENARRMDRVHGALRGTDLPGLRLETFGYALRPRYARPDRGDEPPRIVGYRALNHVRATVDDVDAVGALIDAGTGAGANRVESLEFEVSNSEEARLEALRRAVAKARREAEAVAGAMDADLGPALEVQAGTDQPLPLRYSVPSPAIFEAARQAPETPVEAGTRTVSATVTIRYRLRQGSP